MWGTGGVEVVAFAPGWMRLCLCALPGAALCAWAACRFFGRRPLAMGLLSLSMVMLMTAAWPYFGPGFESRRSGILVWFSIAAGASWFAAPVSLPRQVRSRQALLLGLIAASPVALMLAVWPQPG